MDILLNSIHHILPIIIVLSVLIYVHEMGHYLVARWCGVKVEAFSIGFGYELYGWTDKQGTRWKIGAFPLGGYVKMYGDMDPASQPDQKKIKKMTATQKKEAFHFKSLKQRAAIVAAGPGVNFLFAIVLMAALFSIKGEPFTPPVAETIMPGGPAAKAGIVKGDRLTHIDGRAVERFEDAQQIIRLRPNETITIGVMRNGVNKEMRVTLNSVTIGEGKKAREIGQLGIGTTQKEFVRRDPATALWRGAVHSWQLVDHTFVALGQMIRGDRGTEDLGGILRIGKLSKDAADSSVADFVFFIALLSVNLGLINLFPIPLLDGGHLLFYGIEAILGRPVDEKIMSAASYVGLALVLSLLVFTTWNDLVQLNIFDFIMDMPPHG